MILSHLMPSEPLVESVVRMFSGASGNLSAEQQAQLVTEYREMPFCPTADMHGLWGLLLSLFDAARLTTLDPPFEYGLGEDLRILDVACGRCEEAVTLPAFFARNLPTLSSKSIHFFGTDLRENMIRLANNYCGRTCSFFEPWVGGECSPFCYLLKSGDATSPELWMHLPESFDVVFCRHQNAWHGVEIWTRIFNEALQRCKPEGVLIITSYFDREHQMATQLLSGLGAELVCSIRNPTSRALKAPGKSIDRHIALFRKRGMLL